MTEIIYIEGNIASGKSTVINILKNKYTNVEFIYDSTIYISTTNPPSHNILKLFYENPQRWGFTWLMHSITYKYQQIDNAIKKGTKYVVVEKSWLSWINVYGGGLLAAKYITQMEFEILKHSVMWLGKKYQGINKIIYLDTDPELCFNNLFCSHKFNEHIKINPLLLKIIHDRYMVWLTEMDRLGVTIERLALVSNLYYDTNKQLEIEETFRKDLAVEPSTWESVTYKKRYPNKLRARLTRGY